MGWKNIQAIPDRAEDARFFDTRRSNRPAGIFLPASRRCDGMATGFDLLEYETSARVNFTMKDRQNNLWLGATKRIEKCRLRSPTRSKY